MHLLISSLSLIFLNLTQLSTLIPAKILLWGEYSVMFGSSALAMPLDLFGGAWQYGGKRKQQFQLPDFADFLPSLCQKMNFSLDVAAFQSALWREGLYFEADIPRGYGVGSSGAVVAAVYRTFGGDLGVPLAVLRERLGAMESFFHGSSSGLDPLVSAVQTPILVNTDGTVETPPLSAWDTPELQFFLVDTHVARSTAPLVQLFRQKYAVVPFADLLRRELVPLVQAAIAHTLQGDAAATYAAFEQVSRFQYTHFSEMIPDTCRAAWSAGLYEGAAYRLKLCGAGGGGFLLGATFDWAYTQTEALKNFTLLPLSLFDERER